MDNFGDYMIRRYAGIVMTMDLSRHHTTGLNHYSWNISTVARMCTNDSSPAYFISVL